MPDNTPKGARVRLTVRLPIKMYRHLRLVRTESVNDFIVRCIAQYIKSIKTTEK